MIPDVRQRRSSIYRFSCNRRPFFSVQDRGHLSKSLQTLDSSEWEVKSSGTRGTSVRSHDSLFAHRRGPSEVESNTRGKVKRKTKSRFTRTYIYTVFVQVDE